MRERLANRRRNESFEFSHSGLKFTLTFSRYRDGRISELFLSSHKPGSSVESIARDSAIIASICLQCGGHLETLRAALTRDDSGGPASLIGAALDALGAVMGRPSP
jgi:hypothetical protein